MPVLIYHHVKWTKPQDDAIERGLTVSPSQLVAELAYLARSGYHTTSAASVARYLHVGGKLPAKPVVMTFDDGYADVYANVYEILRRRGMTATFFIVPGFLDRPRYLTWRQVVDMSVHGMDIEAHTMTHPDLALVGPAQRRAEIRLSRKVLEGRLHRAVYVFAYPYGDYNAAIVSDVASAGYWAAFTTHQGWTLTLRDAFTLPRVYVDNDDSIDDFAARLRGDLAVLSRDPT